MIFISRDGNRMMYVHCTVYTDFHSSRTISYEIAFFTILQVCSLGFQIEILGSRRKLPRDTPEHLF